jgi:hypothetical protein
MQRTTWLLLLALQLPATDPVRAQAVAALTARLAECLQAELLEDEEGPVPPADA